MHEAPRNPNLRSAANALGLHAVCCSLDSPQSKFASAGFASSSRRAILKLARACSLRQTILFIPLVPWGIRTILLPTNHQLLVLAFGVHLVLKCQTLPCRASSIPTRRLRSLTSTSAWSPFRGKKGHQKPSWRLAVALTCSASSTIECALPAPRSSRLEPKSIRIPARPFGLLPRRSV